MVIRLRPSMRSSICLLSTTPPPRSLSDFAPPLHVGNVPSHREPHHDARCCVFFFSSRENVQHSHLNNHMHHLVIARDKNRHTRQKGTPSQANMAGRGTLHKSTSKRGRAGPTSVRAGITTALHSTGHLCRQQTQGLGRGWVSHVKKTGAFYANPPYLVCYSSASRSSYSTVVRTPP